MKKSTRILVFLIILLSFTLTPSVLADKSWRIHTPRGGTVKLVVTKSTLKNIRIYSFDFANGGDTFTITAAVLRPAEGSHTLSVSFYEDGGLAQSDYVDIDAEKRTHELYCPESFDQILIEHHG